MDIISHALWGATVVRKKPLLWWAALTGAAPDLLSNGIAFLYLLFAHGRLWSTTTWPLLPPTLKSLYSLTHSLIGLAIVAGLFLLFERRYFVLVLPYALHLAMDLMSHRGDFLYRLLYPLVEYDANRITGLNWWEHWWLWASNLALLVVVNLVVHWHHKGGCPLSEGGTIAKPHLQIRRGVLAGRSTCPPGPVPGSPAGTGNGMHGGSSGSE